MAHLTASPFHKPPPPIQSLPAHPLTPPDTDSEFAAPVQSVSGSISQLMEPVNTLIPPVDDDTTPTPTRAIPHPAPSETDSPGSRIRKVSTLTYRNSGLREPRERLKSPKHFIVVIPPSSIAQEHGPLGHTLSSGPRNKLSQGILMPLFPTLYGQVSAIAREFNFPSTVGIYIYLHITEGGVTVTPRVSDDTWQFLWSQAFDENPPTVLTYTLPVRGRIEFDIDLRKALWYNSWLVASQRDSLEVPLSVISRPPSISHTRGDSRTTFAEEQSGYDPLDTGSITHQSKTPTPGMRQVPKALSLRDRPELPFNLGTDIPARVGSLLNGRSDSRSRHGLNRESQDMAPRSVKQDLQTKVNTWRASALLGPTPLAAKGQTSLEPANMPNTFPLQDDGDGDEVESVLNLDDFTWSVTSAGPSEGSYSPTPSSRIPSVHLDRRNEGSVCLSPTTCTSFGPYDYDLYSPSSSVSRLPSLDLGLRMIEDAPPTPLTATSWGPASWPSSPAYSEYRPGSVDIGHRGMSSRPATPSTATSWGPPSWPSSPVYSDHYPQSIDIGHRGMFSRPATPTTATSWGPPSWPSSPASESRPPSIDLGQRSAWSRPASPSMPPSPTGLHLQNGKVFSFPYYNPWKGAPWNYVWPYSKANEGKVPSDKERQRSLESSIPIEGPNRSESIYPYFNLYPAVDANPTISLPPASTSPSYPIFNIYPAIYPHFDLYPKLLCTELWAGLQSERMNSSIVDEAGTAHTPPSYPHFRIYPAVYPYFDLYPSLYKAQEPQEGVFISQDETENTLRDVPALIVTKLRDYPNFDLYPAVYPASLDYIYPNISGDTGYLQRPSSGPNALALKLLSVIDQTSRFRPAYPVFDLYPVVYPYLDIYPAITVLGEIVPVSLPTSVPAVSNAINVKLEAVYPNFNLYLPVYPYFDIYQMGNATTGMKEMTSISVKLAAQYPAFSLYSPVYPHFDLYHAGITSEEPVPSSKLEQDEDRLFVTVHLPALYPAFDLYPPVFPHFDIYHAGIKSQEPEPSTKLEQEQDRLFVSVHLPALYPAFDLYPPVFPHFNIYRISGLTKEEARGENRPLVTTDLQPEYPAFNIYPAVYPNFELWPPIPLLFAPSVSSLKKVAPLRRTHAQLHAMIVRERESLPVRKARKTHGELHSSVFGGGIVSTPSGASRLVIAREPEASFSTVEDNPVTTTSDPNSSQTPNTSPVQLTALEMQHDATEHFMSKPRKTHQELHSLIFEGRHVSTPSGTFVVPSKIEPPLEKEHPIVRSASSSPEHRALDIRRPQKQKEPATVARPGSTTPKLPVEENSAVDTSTIESVMRRPDVPVKQDVAVTRTLSLVKRRVPQILDLKIPSPSLPPTPPRTRTRSGTVSVRPLPLPPLTPSTPSLPTIQDLPESPQTSRLVPPRTPRGLPASPLRARKSLPPSPRPTTRHLDDHPASGEYGYLSSPLSRAKSQSMAPPPPYSVKDLDRALDRSKSMSDAHSRIPKKRDSLVLQKRVRAYDATAQHPIENTPERNSSLRPPVPPLPQIPSLGQSKLSNV